MNRTTTRTRFSSLLLALAFALTACGGGGGEESVAPPIQWPQPVAFTDFTGGDVYFRVAGSGGGAGTNCQTCITVYGIARSNAELGNLLPVLKTSQSWPSPYNDKLYSELPIDYNSKMAVVLEDLLTGERYKHFMQKVEESADTVTITILKCMVFDVYQNSGTVNFGLLLPKSNKAIKVVTVQSGKPTLSFYEATNGLGAC